MFEDQRQTGFALPISPEVSSPIPEADYAELRQRLEAAVTRVCPSWMATHRDDIVQAALIRILGIVRRGEGKELRASTYLWRIAYCALVDEIRRVRRRQEISLDAAEPDDRPAANIADPERISRAHEIGRGIRDCLARLPQSRREAVALHLIGHSVPEAARLLGWSAKKAENLVYRGLADLRRCLVSKGLEP